MPRISLTASIGGQMTSPLFISTCLRRGHGFRSPTHTIKIRSDRINGST
jgi:hypothetical protein